MSKMYTRAAAVMDTAAAVLPEGFDVEGLKALLYAAFAEEVRAFYAYFVVAPFMVGQERYSIEKTFEELAQDEMMDHAVKLRDRLNELGADVEPIRSLDILSDIARCAYTPPREPYDVRELLVQNIAAEECACRRYEEICRFCEGKDFVTFDMARHILADEQDHLVRLEEFLADIDSTR